MCSCSSYIIEDPQPVYVISNKFGVIVKGTKDFNVKNGYDTMGEWIEEPSLVELSEVPDNLIAFPLEKWLTEIKPAIKSLAKKYSDDRD